MSNFKCQISNKEQKGFTLIELLVVSGIFIIVSVIVISVLVIVLRGTKKSDSISLVRQNGEYAMSQMVRTIRFAKSLDDSTVCDGTSQNHVTVKAVDLTQTTFSCPSYNGSTGIKSESTTTNFLTNTSSVLVVTAPPVPVPCAFVCTQSAGGPPIIGISFTLSKINSSGLPEGDTVIPFQSSVTLRNLSGQ